MIEEISTSQPTQKNNSELEKAWKKGEERLAKLEENSPMKDSIIKDD